MGQGMPVAQPSASTEQPWAGSPPASCSIRRDLLSHWDVPVRRVQCVGLYTQRGKPAGEVEAPDSKGHRMPPRGRQSEADVP